MKVAVTMRTCDRSPGPNYLRGTIHNLRRAGVFDSSHLAGFDVVTSHSPTPAMNRALDLLPGDATVTRSARTLTPNEAATEAHAVADRHDADYVVFIEDDLDFCADFLGSVVRWLCDHDEPQYPLFVLGHVKKFGRDRTSAPYGVRGFYGSQCYTVPRREHARLVEWLSDNPVYDNGKTRVTRCHDLRLHNWARTIGRSEFLASSPSMVDHVGEVSGMGCPRVKFPSFPGRGWTYEGRAAA